jgi:light-regulated signal transduction histidine kinase (bacteriophytochrome)
MNYWIAIAFLVRPETPILLSSIQKVRSRKRTPKGGRNERTYRPTIFDRFYRGDPARTKQVEGLGLGLSLAREIVYAHGGDLTLDDTPAGETAFTLTIDYDLINSQFSIN